MELMQRIRVKKYKESDARGVIKGMVDEIKLKTHHSNFRCWELMVENLAKWLVLNKQTGLACEPPLQGFQGLKLEKDELYEHLNSLDLFRHYYTAAMERIYPINAVGLYRRSLRDGSGANTAGSEYDAQGHRRVYD